MIPVPGTWSAATPVACGSISRNSETLSSRNPATPLARPRSSRSCKRGRSSSEVATMTFPQISHGTPRSRQNSTMAAAPANAGPRLERPGLVVHPRVNDSAVVLLCPLWCAPTPFFLLKDGQLQPGKLPGSLPRDRESYDSAANHDQVVSLAHRLCAWTLPPAKTWHGQLFSIRTTPPDSARRSITPARPRGAQAGVDRVTAKRTVIG